MGLLTIAALVTLFILYNKDKQPSTAASSADIVRASASPAMVPQAATVPMASPPPIAMTTNPAAGQPLPITAGIDFIHEPSPVIASPIVASNPTQTAPVIQPVVNQPVRATVQPVVAPIVQPSGSTLIATLPAGQQVYQDAAGNTYTVWPANTSRLATLNLV